MPHHEIFRRIAIKNRASRQAADTWGKHQGDFLYLLDRNFLMGDPATFINILFAYPQNKPPLGWLCGAQSGALYWVWLSSTLTV